MSVYATNGAKLYIGTALSQKSTDFELADFAGQAWVEVKEVEDLGQIGDTSESIDFTAVGDARARVFKGSRSAGMMEVVCGIDPADPGQLALIAAEKQIHDYAFRLVFNDAAPPVTGPATVTVASPGVVSKVAHGLVVGDKVKFSTTGALPTGLVAGTEYFVITAGLTPDAFQLSATSGGSAIVTSGTQSGTHTLITVPTPSQRLFIAKVMSQAEQFDSANNIMKLNASLAVNSNIVRVNAAPAA
jgi:hypothetical protein